MGSIYSLPAVLIVSKDPAKLSFLKKNLKDKYHILEQHEGKEAIKVAQNTVLDAIIVDSGLADTSPMFLCFRIRFFSEIPILLITRNLKKQFIKMARAVGFTDFLNEPLDKSEVLQRLAAALQKKPQGDNK